MRIIAFELPLNCTLIAVALVGTPCTTSAEPGHPCAVVTSDSERLACYDRTFGHPAEAKRSTPASASGASSAESATSGTPTAGAGPAPAVPAATGTTKAAESGLREDQAQQRQPEKPKPESIESIESAVTAVSRRRTGEFVYTLANGQVWEQSEADSAGWLRDGAPVTIKRAALGSYKLVSGSVATRVRRVQ